MIILKETTSLQEIKFVPTRLDQANWCFVTNETTNEVVSFQINCKKEGIFSKFKNVFSLKEGHFYTIEIKFYGVINNKRGYHLVNRMKAFCTNQVVKDYSVNKDEYVSKDTNIIFYE